MPKGPEGEKRPWVGEIQEGEFADKGSLPARLEVRTSPAVEEPSNTESHLKSEG
jgi:hypothetical protein